MPFVRDISQQHPCRHPLVPIAAQPGMPSTLLHVRSEDEGTVSKIGSIRPDAQHANGRAQEHVLLPTIYVASDAVVLCG
jgi:hypothetical protein